MTGFSHRPQVIARPAGSPVSRERATATTSSVGATLKRPWRAASGIVTPKRCSRSRGSAVWVKRPHMASPKLLRCGDDPFGLVARAVDEVRHLTAGLLPPPEHVRGDDLGIGGVGASHADADAVELGAAELALERLQAVVAGEAAAEPDTDVAERQVDLVVDDKHALELELVGPAGRPDGAPRV